MIFSDVIAKVWGLRNCETEGRFGLISLVLVVFGGLERA